MMTSTYDVVRVKDSLLHILVSLVLPVCCTREVLVGDVDIISPNQYVPSEQAPAIVFWCSATRVGQRGT